MKKEVMLFAALCALPFLPAAAARPVFHCSFDSEETLAKPEAGEGAAIARKINLCEGVSGMALKVPEGGGCAGFYLPKGIPVERGAIEFYARIDNDRPWYRDAGDPNFFSIFDEATTNKMVMGFELNANNGVAKSGWYFRMNHLGWVTSLPHFGWRIDYKTCFGESDPKAWHHYFIQWNFAGLPGSKDVVRVFMDGSQILAMDGTFEHSHTDPEALNRARELMSQPCRLYFSREFHEHGQNHSEYSIDEFKIWDVESGDGGVAAAAAKERRVLKFSDGPEVSAAKRFAGAASRSERWFAGVQLPESALPSGGDVTVEVSGLPPGVAYDAKRRMFTGVPGKAGRYTIVMAITRNGKTTTVRKSVDVEALPEWTRGVFAGGGTKGTVLFMVEDDGLLAGRWTTVDKTWTMQAAGYSKYDEKAAKCTIDAELVCGDEKRAVKLELTPEKAKSADFSAWICEWDSNPDWIRLAEKLEGKTCRVSQDDMDFRFDVLSNAGVEVACKAGGKTHKTLSLLVPVVEEEQLEYRIFVCLPKDGKDFDGYCGEFMFEGEIFGE